MTPDRALIAGVTDLLRRHGDADPEGTAAKVAVLVAELGYRAPVNAAGVLACADHAAALAELHDLATRRAS